MAPRDIEKGKGPSLPGFLIVVPTVLCGTTDSPLAPGLAVQLCLLQIFFFGIFSVFGIFFEFFRFSNFFASMCGECHMRRVFP